MLSISGPCYEPECCVLEIAFLVMLLMCSNHLRSSDIVTPKYFAGGTLSSTQPWR